MKKLELYFDVKNNRKHIGLHLYFSLNLSLPVVYDAAHIDGLLDHIGDNNSNKAFIHVEPYARGLPDKDFIALAEHLRSRNNDLWQKVLISEIMSLDASGEDKRDYIIKHVDNPMQKIQYHPLSVQKALKYQLVAIDNMTEHEALALILQEEGKMYYEQHQDTLRRCILNAIAENYHLISKIINRAHELNLDPDFFQSDKIITFRLKNELRNIMNKLEYMDMAFAPYLTPIFWIHALHEMINVYTTMADIFKYYEKINTYLGAYKPALECALNAMAEHLSWEDFDNEIRHLVSDNKIKDIDYVKGILNAHCPDEFNRLYQIAKEFDPNYSITDALLQFTCTLSNEPHHEHTLLL